MIFARLRQALGRLLHRLANRVAPAPAPAPAATPALRRWLAAAQPHLAPLCSHAAPWLTASALYLAYGVIDHLDTRANKPQAPSFQQVLASQQADKPTAEPCRPDRTPKARPAPCPTNP